MSAGSEDRSLGVLLSLARARVLSQTRAARTNEGLEARVLSPLKPDGVLVFMRGGQNIHPTGRRDRV